MFKTPAGETPITKPEKETTRREFLVKAGKFLGGLAVLSCVGDELFSEVKELIESRKPPRKTEEGGKEANEEKIKGRELFTQERLMEEINEIKRENPENWQEIANERINEGVDKFVKLWTAEEKKKIKPLTEPETMIMGSVAGLGVGIFAEQLSSKKYEEEFNELGSKDAGLRQFLETGFRQVMETITNSPSREIINWYGVGGAFLAEGGRLAKELITKQPINTYKAHWFAAGEIAKKTAFELIFNDRLSAAEFGNVKDKTNTTNIVSEMLKEEIIKNCAELNLMIEDAKLNNYLEHWGASVTITAERLIFSELIKS